MVFRAAPVLLLATALASGQAVISIRSGVVHYFEGTVYLNDQALEPRLGRFPAMPQDSVLRTEQGRAEVLLTPGVILRVDQNTSIRMVSNSLSDSRIELLSGSAIVESGEPAPGTSVTVTYRDWQVRFPRKGVYRIDSNPSCVWVREGEAEVTDARTGQPLTVGRGMDLPLMAALAAEQSSTDPSDALSAWSRGRADSISADNQIAANIQDPATLPDPTLALGDPSQYGFTQFPMIGLAPVSPVVPGAYGIYSTSPYGSLYPYQPGFYSLYLPGYTYRPLFLGLPSGVRSPTVYAPRTGSTITIPRPLGSVYSPPVAPRPMPVARPMPAQVVHPVAPPPHAVGHK
jgi:hypothetical protein